MLFMSFTAWPASAVGHFRAHAPQERAEPGEERWLPAHHDAERAVAGGLRGARNRRVGEGGAGRSSKATTVAPDFLARFRHIGSPMTPSPTNPSTPAVAMPASTCPDFSCTRGTRESPRTALPADDRP